MIQKTIAFIRDVQNELSQVSWPTRRDLLESTKVVVVTMLLLSAVIGMFDLVCARLISWMIR
ncbi:MAG: preprotein translocase subunit SecE [Candidatus Omnitrophica bacterium]|nr:preprotein translocase subunit SecE [Candidatus Omnitrophota bacterium]